MITSLSKNVQYSIGQGVSVPGGVVITMEVFASGNNVPEVAKNGK